MTNTLYTHALQGFERRLSEKWVTKIEYEPSYEKDQEVRLSKKELAAFLRKQARKWEIEAATFEYLIKWFKENLQFSELSDADLRSKIIAEKDRLQNLLKDLIK